MSAENIDKSNVRKVIQDSPNQFRIGWKEAEESLKNYVPPTTDIKKVLICGMGGSSHAGEFIKYFLDAHAYSVKRDRSLIIAIHKDYDLPTFVDNHTLVITSSYSGNTEEILSIFEQATKEGMPTVAMSTGGEMLHLAKERGVPFVELHDTSILPRNSLGYQFSALAYILFRFNLIDDLSLNLFSLAERMEPEMGRYEKKGKDLARHLVGTIPIIYSSQKYQPVAYNWKIRFNETSKTHAFYNIFPELNHNELVAYTHLTPGQKFQVLILEDKDDYPKILKRMDLTKDLIQKFGVDVECIEMEGEDSLTKIFSTVLLADWTSYYLALEGGVDPTPVDVIEELKKKLK